MLRSLKVGRLIKKLRHREPDVRRSAIMELGELDSTRAVSPLTKIMRDDYEDIGVREFAVQVLSELVINALVDDDAGIRAAATEALGWLGDARAKDWSHAHNDELVRKAAVEALKKLEFRAIEPLIDALSDSKPLVRRSAASAVARLYPRWLRKRAAVDFRHRFITPLIKAMGDDDLSVRVAVAEALGKLGDNSAVGALIKALGDSKREVRRAAAEALGMLGNDDARYPLLGLLDTEKDEGVREAVRKALGDLGPICLP